MLACTALVGCTSEDAPEVNNGKDNEKGNAYVTVKLSMSGNAASRTFADGKFKEADEAEYAVTKATFYFLDENGQGCADKYTLTNVDNLKEWTDGGEDANVDWTSGAVVVIKNPITTPKSMVAILNVDDPFSGVSRPSLAQIQAKTVELAAAEKASSFIMSNSVYVKDGKVVVGAEITTENIHTGDDVNQGDKDNDGKKAVVIPVERVVAKVGMSVDANYENDPAEGNTTVKTADEYDISVSVDGWWLDNTSANAYLVKNLKATYTDSPFNTTTWWTDAANTRSYWANMPASMTYNHAAYANALTTDATDYALENVDQTKPTKYVAKATLHLGDATTGQTFVRWLNTIYTENDFFQYIANAYSNYRILNGANETYDLNGKKNQGATADLGATAFGWNYKGKTDGDTDAGLAKLKDYEGIVTITLPTVEGKSLSFVKVATNANGEEAYTAVDAATIQADIRARIDKVLLWLEGRTYYYTDIIHNQDAVDLVEGGVLKGIIRNHLYKLNITGVQGMGTPVPNPNTPITPETPEDDEYSHISAQIQILSYKVVPTQNVILGK